MRMSRAYVQHVEESRKALPPIGNSISLHNHKCSSCTSAYVCTKEKCKIKDLECCITCKMGSIDEVRVEVWGKE